MSYLAQLLHGYCQGLAGHPTESVTTIRVALAGEDDPVRRGVLLGLLAQSLVQQDCQGPTIDEMGSAPQSVIEVSPAILVPTGPAAA